MASMKASLLRSKVAADLRRELFCAGCPGASLKKTAKDWQLKVDLGRQHNYLKDVVGPVRQSCVSHLSNGKRGWRMSMSKIHTCILNAIEVGC